MPKLWVRWEKGQKYFFHAMKLYYYKFLPHMLDLRSCRRFWGAAARACWVICHWQHVSLWRSLGWPCRSVSPSIPTTTTLTLRYEFHFFLLKFYLIMVESLWSTQCHPLHCLRIRCTSLERSSCLWSSTHAVTQRKDVTSSLWPAVVTSFRTCTLSVVLTRNGRTLRFLVRVWESGMFEC